MGKLSKAYFLKTLVILIMLLSWGSDFRPCWGLSETSVSPSHENCSCCHSQRLLLTGSPLLKSGHAGGLSTEGACGVSSLCPSCNGSGRCRVCGGSGKNISENACYPCSGTGACHVCSGSGKI